MAYHIFISYSSPDRAWAKKLEGDLRGRGVNCFLDQLRLNKGEKWEPQLVSQLLDSRHFVVLWSENARKSDWVSEELVRFKINIDPTGQGQPTPGHLLYAVNLQGQNATLAAYQSYSDEAISKAYIRIGSASNIDLDAAAQRSWDTWVAEIAAAVQSDNPGLLVPVAVLAHTSATFLAAPPMKPEFDFVQESDLDGFLQHLGVEKLAALSGRYGASPFDWHPFGTAETVQSLLDNLLSDPAEGINLPFRGFSCSGDVAPYQCLRCSCSGRSERQHLG